MVIFPRVLKLVKCPESGCLAVVHSAVCPQEIFMYQHFRSQVAVVQERVEELPHCDLCVMHMPVGWLRKHWWNQRCDKNTQMWWWIWDEVITKKCTEVNFSLMGEEGADNIKGVDIFKYLGRPLDRSDDNWTEVLRNIQKVRQVLGHLGKFLWMEGADTFISEKFYRTVVQAVFIFGEETWVLLAAMLKKLEGVHLVFLRPVIGKKKRRPRGASWQKSAAGSVLKVSCTQLLQNYIYKRQTTVAYYVTL